MENQPTFIGHHRAKGYQFQHLGDGLTNLRLLAWPCGWGKVRRLSASYGHPGAELFLELVSLVGIKNAAQLWEISADEVALIRESLSDCYRIVTE